MSDKPHKGRIEHWHFFEVGEKRIVIGRFVDHPQFAMQCGQTSYIVAHDEITGEIETRNSRYTLVGGKGGAIDGFVAFPKIARLNRDIVITEKIDGTNACVVINEWGAIGAQSRNKLITPGKKTDNMGFAGWVRENRGELQQLGPGRHFGEWWGSGINRGYGLPKGEKRFSLFNVAKWADKVVPANDDPSNVAVSVRPACCHVVPTLYEGPLYMGAVRDMLNALITEGSVAAPGFMNPEGIIVFHTAASTLFKVTCKNDEKPKALANDNAKQGSVAA